MKIIINDDINMIIFLNKMYLLNIDFNNEENIEKYFKKLLKKLKNYYNININGYYEIDVYIDKLYGVVLELEKQELEYYGYFDDEVDMQITIYNKEFVYEIKDYFWIDDKIKNKTKIYKYKNKLYLVVKEKIKELELGKILEHSKIIYNLNNNLIIREQNELEVIL